MRSIAQILEGLLVESDSQSSAHRMIRGLRRWAQSHGLEVDLGSVKSSKVIVFLLSASERLGSSRIRLAQLRRMLRPMGWTVGWINKDKGPDGRRLYLHLEPLRGEPVDAPRSLFHVTTKHQLPHILRHGLRPRTANHTQTFGRATPKRIYVFGSRLSALWWADQWDRDYSRQDAVVLKITKSRLPTRAEFYYDPAMPSRSKALWTTSRIPVKAIKVAHGRTFVWLTARFISDEAYS